MRTNKKNIFIYTLFLFFALAPLPLFANEPSTFSEFIDVFLSIFSLLVPTLIGLTLLVFFWGLAKYILALSGGEILGDDGKKKKDPVEDGKRLMLWGIIALFVMVSIWGIIEVLLGDFLGIGMDFPPQLPTSSE